MSILQATIFLVAIRKNNATIGIDAYWLAEGKSMGALTGDMPAKSPDVSVKQEFDLRGDQFELIRRRLEDEVKAKVERDLFRYYRNVGSLVLAVLGSVGLLIGWPQLKALVQDQVKTQVKEQVEAPVQAAKNATAEAAKSAGDAKKTADGILVRLEERQLELKEDIGRVNVRYDEAAVNFGTAKTRLNGMNSEIDSLQLAIGYFRDLAKRDPISRAEHDELKSSLASVATQASELARILDEFIGAGRPAAASKLALDGVAAAQTEAIEQQAAASKANPRGTSTVFVQFAGGRRKDIEAVSTALKSEGWAVPGEERIAGAAGLNEIRYFHDEDRAAAELLQADYNEALTAAGFMQTQVHVREEPTPVKNLPAKGVLEVWLQIPLLQSAE